MWNLHGLPVVLWVFPLVLQFLTVKETCKLGKLVILNSRSEHEPVWLLVYVRPCDLLVIYCYFSNLITILISQSQISGLHDIFQCEGIRMPLLSYPVLFYCIWFLLHGKLSTSSGISFEGFPLLIICFFLSDYPTAYPHSPHTEISSVSDYLSD